MTGTCKNSVILVPVTAYNRCWFFGDEFTARSFDQYFQGHNSADYNGYVKVYFDTFGFFHGLLSDNPSKLSRMGNLMVQAVNYKSDRKLRPFPKIIVVVPDVDLLKCFTSAHSISKPIGRFLNYVMTEHDRAIAAYKEHLPAKCLHSDFPQILWIQAPEHQNFNDNDQRRKFNKSLEEVCQFHNNVHALMLKRVWDPKDGNLFLADSQRFTTDGLKCYWEAVDRTVRYFDSVLLKKIEKEKRKNLKQHKGDQKDQFRWQNPAFNKSFGENTREYRKLPPPPLSATF